MNSDERRILDAKGDAVDLTPRWKRLLGTGKRFTGALVAGIGILGALAASINHLLKLKETDLRSDQSPVVEASVVAVPEFSATQERLVLDLKREVAILRGTWENTDMGEKALAVVAKNAAPLAERLAQIDDSDLTSGVAITKHQYVLYSYLMAADAERNPEKAVVFGRKGVLHGEVALDLVRDAQGRDAKDEFSRSIVDWILEEKVPDRINFLMAQSLAVMYRNGEMASAVKARQKLEQVSTYFKEYYEYEANPILAPILTPVGREDDQGPSTAPVAHLE